MKNKFNLETIILHLGGNRKNAMKALKIFYENAEGYIRKIEGAVKAEDFLKMAEAFHNYKGIASYLKYGELQRVCEKACREAEQKEAGDYEGWIRDIKELTAAFTLFIKEHLGEP